jgi:hypothetical protein
MTSPYHFYFVFVPRRTSNLREVRFGEVAVLKQISVLHHKNSWKFSEYCFDLRFLVHMPQVIYKLLLVLHFSIWATEGPRKNRSLSAVLFWQILPLFVFFSRSLSCWVLLITKLLRKFETEPKGWIYYHAYTNVANRIVWSFLWRKFSSVGNGEWWDEMKYGQKLKLGDAPEAPLLHR